MCTLRELNLAGGWAGFCFIRYILDHQFISAGGWAPAGGWALGTLIVMFVFLLHVYSVNCNPINELIELSVNRLHHTHVLVSGDEVNPRLQFLGLILM